MKTLLRIFLVAPGALLCAVVVSGNDRFTETRARIMALIGARLDAQPLPEELSNPFATGSGRPTVEARPGTPVRADDDESILARFAASLRIMGVMRTGGTPHLVINSSPYKEGDLIQLPDSNPPEYARIARIAARELTLVYRGATLTIPLP